MFLDENLFTKSETGLYVSEISTLQIGRLPASFTLKNVPTEGQNRTFNFEGVDSAGEGEIAGWRYVESGPTPVLRALIIND